MSAPVKILVVDDEPPIRKLLRTGLGTQGYEVLEAPNGKAALELLAKKPDLVILDLGLPDIEGLELLKRIRDAQSGLPIVVLSSRGDEAGKVSALDLGADDYVTKPFALRELMSRIRALLRRAYGDLANAAGGRVIRHGDLVIDLERRRVQRGNRRIGLTATEFEILRHLAARPGRVFSRRELLELLRDYEALDQDEKTINVHVSHLREKIEDDPSVPQFVLTVRGAGYQFAER
jgi:two-component system, OmpR family, KDP operon response regulator KdpE